MTNILDHRYLVMLDHTAPLFVTSPTVSLLLPPIPLLDTWFEHTGYVDGTFFDNTKEGCEWPWNASQSNCNTPTNNGPEWHGKGNGYDTSTIGNRTVEFIHSSK